MIYFFDISGSKSNQAMRVTGAADPTVSVKDTMEGKLPQKKLVRGAAQGYSSYGNQIGLATGSCNFPSFFRRFMIFFSSLEM